MQAGGADGQSVPPSVHYNYHARPTTCTTVPENSADGKTIVNIKFMI